MGLDSIGILMCNTLGKNQHSKLVDANSYCASQLTSTTGELKREKEISNNALRWCQSESKALTEELIKYQRDNGDLQNQVAAADNQLNVCQGEKLSLQNELAKYTNGDTAEAQQIINAYPRVDLHYMNKRYLPDEYGVKVYVDFDVREFISSRSWLVKNNLASAFNLYHPKNEWEVVSACWSWLMDDRGVNAKYRSDDYQGSIFNDFWQFANETIALKKGNCEDLAFAVIAMLYAANIPSHRSRAVLGTYGDIGHAWAEYYTGKEWALLEATQYHKFEDPLTTTDSHSEYRRYYCFNRDFAWCINDSITFGELIGKEWYGAKVEKLKEEWKL